MFQIQIPSEVIRNPTISHDTFYVYAKLLQHYYVHKGKSRELSINHKKFMYFSNIKSNQTFKKILKQLYEGGLIVCEINNLPRHGNIDVELNGEYLGKDKTYYFAQLPYWLLDQGILDMIHYEGFRLMYYFKSYINKSEDKCYCSRETIADEIGSSPNTVDKYTNVLKKMKLISITKHTLKDTGTYETNEFGVENRKVTKYNNHYTIRFDQFEQIQNKFQ